MVYDKNDKQFNTGFYIFDPRKDKNRNYYQYGKQVDIDALHDKTFNLGDVFGDRSKWLENNEEKVKELHKVLGSLPNSEKQVIDLIFFQRMSFGDASSIMGIARGACQSYYKRALKHMQQYYLNDALQNGNSEGVCDETD